MQVLAITEDAQGYVWLGTNGGVARFDGDTFASFTVADGLPGNSITSLGSGPDGHMWVSTLGGTVVRQQTGFVPIGGAALAGATHLASDGERMWAIRGSRLVSVTGTRVRAWSRTDGLPSDTVLALAASGGTAWVSTTGGLVRIRRGRVVRVALPAETPPPVALAATAGGVLGRVKDGLLRVSGGRAEVRRFTAAEAVVPGGAFVVDPRGRVWIGDGGGTVWRFGGGRMALEARFGSESGIPPASITALHVGAAGEVWGGSSATGLWRIAHQAFALFDSRDGLSADNVWATAAADGVRYAGTSDGLFRMTPAGFVRDARVAPGEEVRSLLTARDGRLWIGTVRQLIPPSGRPHRSQDPARIGQHDSRRARRKHLDRLDGRRPHRAGRACERLRATRPAGRAVRRRPPVRPRGHPLGRGRQRREPARRRAPRARRDGPRRRGRERPHAGPLRDRLGRLLGPRPRPLWRRRHHASPVRSRPRRGNPLRAHHGARRAAVGRHDARAGPAGSVRTHRRAAVAGRRLRREPRLYTGRVQPRRAAVGPGRSLLGRHAERARPLRPACRGRTARAARPHHRPRARAAASAGRRCPTASTGAGCRSGCACPTTARRSASRSSASTWCRPRASATRRRSSAPARSRWEHFRRRRCRPSGAPPARAARRRCPTCRRATTRSTSARRAPTGGGRRPRRSRLRSCHRSGRRLGSRS